MFLSTLAYLLSYLSKHLSTLGLITLYKSPMFVLEYLNPFNTVKLGNRCILFSSAIWRAYNERIVLGIKEPLLLLCALIIAESSNLIKLRRWQIEMEIERFREKNIHS